MNEAAAPEELEPEGEAPPLPPHVVEPAFKCGQCGAFLRFAPGTESLRCGYCGFVNQIVGAQGGVEELDFEQWLSQAAADAPGEERLLVKCPSCAAETQARPNVVAQLCPFCGASIVAPARSKRTVKPLSLLPFIVTDGQAWGLFRGWIDKLWFAPSDLKRLTRERSPVRGIYIPYWTYDANTYSRYTGQRGDDYWTTEHYTTVVNGRTQHHTRQVRRTRWSYANGSVRCRFDDVLVLASRSLPHKCAEALEPWDVKQLIPYDDAYLSGFEAENYQVDLKEGFALAEGIMEIGIRRAICTDIGGDHQRIASVETEYSNVTFKHVLLPVWLSAYRYGKKVYRFLINGRTGEVQGERPWSWVKIVFFTLAIAALIGGGILIAQYFE